MDCRLIIVVSCLRPNGAGPPAAWTSSRLYSVQLSRGSAHHFYTPTNMTMSPRVLRFDRSDEPGSFVLVHVVQGSSSLDLTLTATEGEAAYKASSTLHKTTKKATTNNQTVKQSSLKDLRSKSYQGSDDEWTQIIRRILGQSTEDDKTSSFKLEATATITESESDESSIIITIRKRVQDITVCHYLTLIPS